MLVAIDRRGDEVLHLARAQALALEVQRQPDHRLQRRAGVPRDVVGDQVLFLARLLARAREHVRELLVGLDAGLLHLVEHRLVGVLGCDAQLPTGVVHRQLLDELRALRRQVVAHAAGDEDLAHAGLLADLLQQVDEWRVVGDQVLADARVHAGEPATGLLDLLLATLHLVHVRGRPADVADHALEAVHAAQLAYLAQHALAGARLDHAPLVLGDRAERAAAEAAAHGHDGVLHRLERRDQLRVARVRAALERQVVQLVHQVGVERLRGRVQVDGLDAVRLHDGAAVARVGLQLERARHLAERVAPGRGVGADFLVRGQHDGLLVAHEARLLELLPAALAHHEARAPDVAHVLDLVARLEPLGELPDRALAHAEDHHVGLGVEQDRAAHLLAPVVVVGDPAQRGLDASEHDRHAGIGAARHVRVHDAGPVGPGAGASPRRILVLRPHLLLRGQLVEHAVEVAGGDAHEQPGGAHHEPVVEVVPARLRDHAHAEAARLEEATDQRPAERRVVDVRVAVDDEHVELVPAARLHLLARGGQESGPLTRRLSPIFSA
jgi:hypothetical protein